MKNSIIPSDPVFGLVTYVHSIRTSLFGLFSFCNIFLRNKNIVRGFSCHPKKSERKKAPSKRKEKGWTILVAESLLWDTYGNPTNPFTISESQDQEIGIIYIVQERNATHFEAPKFCKCSSGRVDGQCIAVNFCNQPRLFFLEMETCVSSFWVETILPKGAKTAITLSRKLLFHFNIF